MELSQTVGVVPTLALCLEPSRLALVMRLMSDSVWDSVQSIGVGKLPDEFAGRPWVSRLDLAHKCAKRLSALHAVSPPRGPVIHRDIKAANFLVSPSCEVFLADLGLAKTMDESPISKYAGHALRLHLTLTVCRPQNCRHSGLDGARIP